MITAIGPLGGERLRPAARPESALPGRREDRDALAATLLYYTILYYTIT